MFDKVERILICKLKFYGDVLLITPVIASIQARYPHAKIDLLLYKDTRAILAADERINNFYLIEKKKGLLETIKNYISVRRQLKKNHYDLIINLTEQWPIGALIASLRRPSIAFKRDKKQWNCLFTKVTPTTGTHIVEQNLSILKGLDFSESELKKEMLLCYRESDYQYLLTQLPALSTQKYVVIQPTARQSFKCWDDEKFAHVIDYLQQRGLHVYLTCGPAVQEQQQVARIAGLCQSPPDLTVAGKTTFLQLAALIDHAILYIGVDSAPMHMAAALGTPQVCLFGATNYQQWKPWSDKAALIWAGDYHPMPTRAELDRSRKYLTWIPEHAVIDAIDTVLHDSNPVEGNETA
ncbi:MULTISPECIES: lipopolysaccharide core heptosyltransferase RfaQ [Citrobacter]|uniref:lipopolysaccharide core heptosyltransferase RfaQ n=1 Tax=Citrobacter TaxID=544 RepID=UPI0008DCA739|nr:MULTISPECIES: lipopolysaccharide core heptosyltransferase RfaQ [Citrobacter]MBE0024689.1 lipopolysaccharide core heptosyltransferase RfaQ [Citrobacter koseri]MBE0080766.1 lipopolysaccharide core heptosyltransferase RfaQ [Citrobacter koseri]MBJ8810816.1 lipopolysaccharide core heptosyltransferase RfaQ [Citrobacter koseri]MBJ9346482.1 lipopolysaccharide core heptosyltransferase RfaQ [Citrobacter koseri]MBJ9354797.1 lipopolysaccharide core heptosyltransferase RfaQ [Citrobacter koseri]